MFRTSSTPAASSSSGTTSSSEEDWGYIRHAVVESVFEEEEVSDLDLQPDVPLRRGSLFRSRVDSGGDGVFHLLTGTGQTDEDEDEDGEGETNSFLKDRKESSRWRRNSTEWVEEQKDRKREERKFSKGKDNRVLKGSTLQGEKQDGRDGGLVVVAEETMLPFHMQRETPEHRRARTISLYICVLTLLLDMVMFAIPLPSLALYLRHLEKGDIDIYSTGQLANPDNTFYGITVGSYALGQMISSPIVGHLALRMGTKLPSMRSNLQLFPNGLAYIQKLLQGLLLLFILASFLYGAAFNKWMVLVARFLIGVGDGNVTLCRTYVSMYSTTRERGKFSNYLGLAMATGNAIGFFFGTMFAGVNLFPDSPFHINVYTAPGYFSVLLGLVNLTGVSLYLLDRQEYRDRKGYEEMHGTCLDSDSEDEVNDDDDYDDNGNNGYTEDGKGGKVEKVRDLELEGREKARYKRDGYTVGPTSPATSARTASSISSSRSPSPPLSVSISTPTTAGGSTRADSPFVVNLRKQAALNSTRQSRSPDLNGKNRGVVEEEEEEEEVKLNDHERFGISNESLRDDSADVSLRDMESQSMPPPKLPTGSILLCILCYFVNITVLSLMETLQAPYMIDNYNWDVFYIGLVGMSGGLMALVVFFILPSIQKTLGFRYTIMSAYLALATLLDLATFPWAPQRCAPAWFFVMTVICTFLSYAVVQFSLIFAFTLILYQFQQATYIGYMVAAGSLARIVGPLWATELYELNEQGRWAFPATGLLCLVGMMSALAVNWVSPEEVANAAKKQAKKRKEEMRHEGKTKLEQKEEHILMRQRSENHTSHILARMGSSTAFDFSPSASPKSRRKRTPPEKRSSLSSSHLTTIPETSLSASNNALSDVSSWNSLQTVEGKGNKLPRASSFEYEYALDRGFKQVEESSKQYPKRGLQETLMRSRLGKKVTEMKGKESPLLSSREMLDVLSDDNEEETTSEEDFKTY